SLFFRNRLSAVDVFVLGLALSRVDFRQVFGGSGDVIPATILEIDQGLIAPVDGNDSADNPFKALQLWMLRIDPNVLVGPFPLDFFSTSGFSSVHGASRGEW